MSVHSPRTKKKSPKANLGEHRILEFIQCQEHGRLDDALSDGVFGAHFLIGGQKDTQAFQGFVVDDLTPAADFTSPVGHQGGANDNIQSWSKAQYSDKRAETKNNVNEVLT